MRFVCGFAWNGFSRGLTLSGRVFYWRGSFNQINHVSQQQTVGDPVEVLAQFYLPNPSMFISTIVF
jgi:hypothetical protein